MSTKLSFEQALKRIEDIVAVLEKGDQPLDHSIKLFEEGMELIQFCNKKLTEAEKKVKKLVKDQSGDIHLEDFKESDETERNNLRRPDPEDDGIPF